MFLRTETIQEKKLIGRRMRMSLSDNKTFELWKSFMPRRREIKNNLTNDLISMQVYLDSFELNYYNLDATFDKWAAVEVSNFDSIPHEMESVILKGGLYAVFLHKGAAITAPKTFQYIFGEWLPNSEFALDNRPQFEIIGDRYKNDDPNSEEEVYIPIRPKV